MNQACAYLPTSKPGEAPVSFRESVLGRPLETGVPGNRSKTLSKTVEEADAVGQQLTWRFGRLCARSDSSMVAIPSKQRWLWKNRMAGLRGLCA